MTAPSEAAIRQAIDSIDQWVQRKPPAAYYQREYELPWDQDTTGENACGIFEQEPLLASFIDHFGEYRKHITGMNPGSVSDARKFDGAYFDAMRKKLLDEPLWVMQSLLTSELSPELACRALTALLYGNVQKVLWSLHVNQTARVAPHTLFEWGMGAEYALRQLLDLRSLSESDRVDTMIRLLFVLSWSLTMAGNHPLACKFILALAGWFAHAEKNRLTDVTHSRYGDYVSTLCAMLDYETQATLPQFTDSAALLLKRLDSDRYCVSPAWLAAWADPRGTPASVAGQPFDIPRLVKAQGRLGRHGALIDIVMTDNRLHVRVVYLNDRRHIRDRLAETERLVPQGESPRGISYLTPGGVVLAPILRAELEEEFRSLAALRSGHKAAADDAARTEAIQEQATQDAADQDQKTQDAGAPTQNLAEQSALPGPRSDIIHWQAIFKKVHVFLDNNIRVWRLEWTPTYYPSSDDFWRTLYDMIYAKIVPELKQRGIRHLVISPDGSLASLPHHLLRDASNRRLGDDFHISYAPNLLGLTACLDADGSDAGCGSAVVVVDPQESIRFAARECADVAAMLSVGATVVEPAKADVTTIRQQCRGAGVLHFSGHAVFDWAMPEESYLSVRDGKMRLNDIRALQFAPGAMVFLSACNTARAGRSEERCTPNGMVNAFFEAGAATVVGTLWPVHSAATALIAHWFYRAWRSERKGRLESLLVATTRLREATRTECETVLGERARLRGEKPFADEYYWGAFVLHGAW